MVVRSSISSCNCNRVVGCGCSSSSSSSSTRSNRIGGCGGGVVVISFIVTEEQLSVSC